MIESADGPASGPDPTKDTVLMDAWAQFATAHSAVASAEPFAVPSVEAAIVNYAASEAAPASPAAAQQPAMSEVSGVSHSPVPAAATDSPANDPLLAGQAAFRAAETLSLPREDYSGGREHGATDFPTGENAESPHQSTVVDVSDHVGNANPSLPEVTAEVSTAESSVPVPATAKDVSASSPPVDSGGLADAAAALTGLHSGQSSTVLPLTQAPTRTNVRPGISSTLFMVVVSYASAMTLACLYLAFQLLSNPRTHDLPDLAPPKPKDKKKVVSLMYISPDQALPPANVLKLGESRRYGSLKVTPLRVTRGPVEFEYYDPAADQHKDPEGPVLKLHLRFENISSDQEFTPLDSMLVFHKDIDRTKYGMVNANNFVCQVADRKNRAKQVLTFDLTPNGNWLVKGENLDREFQPGQVLETFIPTTPDQIETLSGDLVWRVHFRKGYNRTSYRGVTTLIEVFFKDSDIVEEEPPAPAQIEPAPSEKESAPAKKEPDDPAQKQHAAKDA